VAALAVLILAGWASLGQAQEQSSARDIHTSCLVTNLPPLDLLSVTWSGDCLGGQASGVGNLFAFSRGELRYLLRGLFVEGRLSRRDQLQQCAADLCADQVAVSLVRAHLAAYLQRKGTLPMPSTTNVEVNAANVEIKAVDGIYRGSFLVDPKSGAVSGTGRVEFFDGRLFIGKLKDGRKEGNCTYVWANGYRYVGDWFDDLQEGMGEWSSPDGDRYVGEFKRGKREGKGVMTYAKKTVYEGTWIADLPSGTGTLRFPNGDVYEGQFVAGERTGNGTLTYQNGDRYTGQWLKGERHGNGLAQSKDQQRYEGNWQHDRKEGDGVMRFPDGGTYEGAWKDDRATGSGRITFASGDSYFGNVSDGQPQGKGVYKWGSGDQFDGEFDSGKPTSTGVMTFHIDEPGAPSVATATDVAPAGNDDNATNLSGGSIVTLCSKGYNAARTVSALRRFMEAFPDDECRRHALASQKIAILEKSERKVAKEQDERFVQAKALVGLVVAFGQEYPFCVIGSGPNCQRVTYRFEVKGKIKDVDIARQSVQVQVVEVALRGAEKGAAPQLVEQGRAAVLEAFRSRTVGTIQWKTKSDVGMAF
jgi:hypothetical protein